MPDWTYHPLFKHIFFLFPGEEARRLTIGLLAVQAKTALGRRIFRIFASGAPPEGLGVRVFGIDFPSPVGMAPGIDVDAAALSVMQHLGFGFMQVGPAGESGRLRRFDADPVRIRERGSVVQSPHAAGPSAAALADRVKASPDLAIPVGMALREPHLDAALRSVNEGIAFFTLPGSCAASREMLAGLRAITKRPLLLRIDPAWDEAQLFAALDAALEASWDGCVAPSGLDCPMLPDGILDGPSAREQALRVIRQVSQRYGERLPIIGAGGISKPEDAIAQLEAGAKLVELYAGFVFAGPGLPARIGDSLLQHRAAASTSATTGEAGASGDAAQAPGGRGDEPGSATGPYREPAAASRASPRPQADASGVIKPLPRWGWVPLAVAGAGAATEGLAGILGTAAGRLVLQPPLSPDAPGLATLLRFQLATGGALFGWGVIVAWVAAARLARCEPWAFWGLGASGIVSVAGLAVYQGVGRSMSWQGWATLGLAALIAGGLWQSFREVKPLDARGFPFRAGARAWRWSPAGLGRAYVALVSLAASAGGLALMYSAAASSNAPGGVPLAERFARTGLGGSLSAVALVALLAVWCGARPGERGLWRALLLAGLGVSGALLVAAVVHPAPAIVASLLFFVGMAHLHTPFCRTDPSAETFPDFEG
jgi:dihydroorotate dehydrogenase